MIEIVERLDYARFFRAECFAMISCIIGGFLTQDFLIIQLSYVVGFIYEIRHDLVIDKKINR